MHIVYAVGIVIGVALGGWAVYEGICWGVDSAKALLAECDKVERESEDA